MNYLDARDDQTLCGAALVDATVMAEAGPTDDLCPECDAKLITYHLHWWRERALAVTAELDALRAKYGETSEPPAPAESAPSETTEPATFLDRARRELVQLVGQFEGSVPYFRLKNTMQAFSDTLDTEERVLLAQEIGADGSLIRWSTTEVEALGCRVTNSPVHEETEAMWETWHQDSYQPPPSTKRRFGRSRRG